MKTLLRVQAGDSLPQGSTCAYLHCTEQEMRRCCEAKSGQQWQTPDIHLQALRQLCRYLAAAFLSELHQDCDSHQLLQVCRVLAQPAQPSACSCSQVAVTPPQLCFLSHVYRSQLQGVEPGKHARIANVGLLLLGRSIMQQHALSFGYNRMLCLLGCVSHQASRASSNGSCARPATVKR